MSLTRRNVTSRQCRVLALLAVVGAACLVSCLATPAFAQTVDMKTEVLERCKKATVQVWTAMSERERGDTPFGSGTGYFINRTGLLITNNHVVDPTHRKSADQKRNFHYRAGRLVWTVVTDAGTPDEHTWECEVLRQNEWADQALLQAYVGRPEDGEMLDTPYYLPILPESRLQRRLPVWTLGFPGGDNRTTKQGEHPEVSITRGHILEIQRTAAGRIALIYVDSLARPGNSGGPCVNSDGFVVGTLTIMAAPEGREDAGGNTGAGLVPCSLTTQFVKASYFLGKIPVGSDPTPFMMALKDDSGRINIPEFARRADEDVVYYLNGDRVYGTIETASITWHSPLGPVEVPTDTIAYVYSDDDGAKLFLEGGNLIHASEVGSMYKFKPRGGKEVEQSFDDVRVVAFRTKDRKIEDVVGDVLLFETESANLTLSGVEGKVKFEGPAGVLNMDIEDVVRIDTREEDDQQIVRLKDGMLMTGKFVAEPITATIASTNTPIKLTIDQVRRGVIETAYKGVTDVRGIDLAGVVADGDTDVRDAAKLVESKKFDEAWKEIEKIKKSPRYKDFSDLKKTQIQVIEGVASLRQNKYQEATASFRKAARNLDADHLLSSFSNAFLEVLKRNPSFKYNDNPLSDRATFAEAGMVIYNEQVAKVQNLLRDYREITSLAKGEYTRNIMAVRKHEKEMRMAGVLGGLDADTELIRLWQFATELVLAEDARLQQEFQDIQKDFQERSQRAGGGRGGRGGRGGGGMQARLNRELGKINKQREALGEVYQEYQYKLWTAGFRDQDPDLEREKDRRRSDKKDDGSDKGP